MARIRAFENAAEEASKGGVAAFGANLSDAKVRGPLHLSTGQEAVAAGVCIHLARELVFGGLVSKDIEQAIDESSHPVSRRPGLVL